MNAVRHDSPSRHAGFDLQLAASTLLYVRDSASVSSSARYHAEFSRVLGKRESCSSVFADLLQKLKLRSLLLVDMVLSIST